MNHFLFPTIIAAMLVVTVHASAQSDETKSKLLQRFPDADKDKDGKLSEQEMLDLKKWIRKNGGVAAQTGTTAPPGTAAKPDSKEQKADRRRAKMRVTPTFTDVAYGPLERNTLDFWKAESSTPAPLLVLIHAGGFTGGDKSFWYSHPLVSFCHEHGISVAAINYRLVRTDPYPAPMHDGARAVQFLRSKAAEWNIDSKRIAVAGGSAGACIAVWLGMHDDLADPKSADPIVHESTRVAFVISYDGQTSLDPEVNTKINALSTAHPWYGQLFGMPTTELKSDRARKLIDDATALNFVSKDDPPVYMNYQMDLTPIPLPKGDQNMHHPHFGVLLKAKMDALGLESVLHYLSKPAQPGEDFEFITKHFAPK